MAAGSKGASSLRILCESLFNFCLMLFEAESKLVDRPTKLPKHMVRNIGDPGGSILPYPEGP